MSEAEKFQAAAHEIRQAASTMSEAADKMRQVLRDYDYTVTCHQRFMSRWLDSLQETLRDLLPSEENPLMVKMLDDDDKIITEPPASEKVVYPSDRPTMPVPFGGEELVGD